MNLRPWREVVKDPMYWLLIGALVLWTVLRATDAAGWQQILALSLAFGTLVVDRMTRPASPKKKT